MNVIKKFLIDCGYTEEFIGRADVKFNDPKLIDLIERWQYQPSIRKFVEFAARFHLTPYSGNRECLLFKLEISGSAVRNTVIGGFNGNKQEFELAGTRLNPEKINPALSSISNWQLATDELALLAQQLDVFCDENEKPTSKYFWVKMSRPDIDNVLEKLLGKWLDSVKGSDSGKSVPLREYFLGVFESRGGNDGKWVGEYRRYNQLSAKEKASDEQAIKELWTKGSTWVASIKNGIMSGDDYRKSEPDLIKFTRKLIEGSSPELYQQSIEMLNRLLNEGKISRRYWATTNRVFASLHPTELSTTVAEDALRKVYQYLDARFHLKLKNPSSLNWYGLNQELLETIQPQLKDIMDTDAINVTLWYIYESLDKANPVDNLEVREPASEYGKKIMKSPLNQILYGPPGTGKTYHTIEAAVKAAEPDEYAALGIELKLGANEEQRRLLTKMYRTLSDAGRIRFVTFHQSYGYEEFVEGVSAKTENGHISYYEKDGVFKCIVEDAKKCRETRTTDEKHDFDTLWNRFIEKLSTSEEGVKVDTIRTFFMVTDVDNNTVRFEKDKGNSTHSLSVKTLKAIFNGVREIKGGLNPYYSALIKHLKQLAQAHSEVRTERRNYVLVIDEINRGNISKIFGELITLIEPSKRKGANEELEVILPYSGETFFVPDNLHIIGTMNTADRSLAMMDTALRRRFDFKEMMPNPDVFEGREVKGINISQLLRVLNKRIEVLYDREHTLGHAFLFPVFNEVDENKAFVELQAAFKNKIIPLLEEYFYEDWNKIRLVLGDSLKEDKKLQFLEMQKDSYLDLFGENHALELYEEAKITYQVKPFESTDSVWSKAEAYIGIYSPKVIMSETSEG